MRGVTAENVTEGRQTANGYDDLEGSFLSRTAGGRWATNQARRGCSSSCLFELLIIPFRDFSNSKLYR